MCHLIRSYLIVFKVTRFTVLTCLHNIQLKDEINNNNSTFELQINTECTHLRYKTMDEKLCISEKKLVL